MKYRRLWILLGGLVVLTAVFLLVNFHAAVSNTQAEHNITTTTSGDRLPDSMQRKDKITIAVVGEGPLVSALQKAIIVEMRKAGMGDVELVQELVSAYKNPVLAIKVGQPGVIWTPFFATSRFILQAGYASNGDTTFMSDTPIVYDSKDGPTINMSAEYKLNDRSWGIMSRPGYYQILSEWLAHNIVEATKNLYH